jgi:transposase
MTRIQDINDIDTLKFAAIQLGKENVRLNERNYALEVEISQLKGLDAKSIQQRIAQLEAIVAKQNRALYGSSSEQRHGPADGAGDGDKTSNAPRTGHGPRVQLKLRVTEQVEELPEDQRICMECGGELEPMGDQFEESEEITIIEREPIMVRIKRRKSRCSCNGCVKTAPAPPKLIPGGRYSIAFSVTVAVDKYLFHIPLERQVRMFRQIGLEVDSQTLWDQIWALIRLVRPTYEAIRLEIFREPVIHADETPWFLLDGRRNGGKKKWYLWEVVGHDLAYYEIHDSRGIDDAAHLLTGYEGTVMADGYEIYQDLATRLKQGRLDDPEAPGPFRVVNCMAHARREFVDCEPNFRVECKEILELIGELYAVERKVPKELPEDAALAVRGRLRDKESRPIVERIRTWLDNTPALPRSGLGKALQYMKNHWSGLTAFLDDPRQAIDNNHGERSMRGPVVGRKNFYGSKSRRGTEAAAVLYTIAESAKLSGVDPKAYLAAIVRRAIEEPGAVLLPADFRRLEEEKAAAAAATATGEA